MSGKGHAVVSRPVASLLGGVIAQSWSFPTCVEKLPFLLPRRGALVAERAWLKVESSWHL